MRDGVLAGRRFRCRTTLKRRDRHNCHIHYSQSGAKKLRKRFLGTCLDSVANWKAGNRKPSEPESRAGNCEVVQGGWEGQFAFLCASKFDTCPAPTLDFCGWQVSLNHPRVYVRDGEGNVELCGLLKPVWHRQPPVGWDPRRSSIWGRSPNASGCR
jgi:hypothetical protein